MNPLSITDDGSDDDKILDMGFRPLDEPYRKFIMPRYRYDEDIDDSFRSEALAETEVAKAMEAQEKAKEKAAEEAAAKAVEKAAKEAAAPAKKEAAPAEQPKPEAKKQEAPA